MGEESCEVTCRRDNQPDKELLPRREDPRSAQRPQPRDDAPLEPLTSPSRPQNSQSDRRHTLPSSRLCCTPDTSKLPHCCVKALGDLGASSAASSVSLIGHSCDAGTTPSAANKILPNKWKLCRSLSLRLIQNHRSRLLVEMQTS